MEPRLSTPVLMSFIAGILFFLAYRINPQSSFQEGFKLLLILLAVLCALWAFVTGADYLIHRGTIHVKALRQAWNAPRLETLRYVASMDREQIRLYEHIGPFESISYLGNTGMRHTIYTPMGNIPYTWVIEYLQKCEPIYPNFIPQNGMPDNLQRDYVRWFTGLAINNGMAEKPIGNRPAKWSVPMDQVYEKLEIVEV